ncbi:MAG: 3-isopropylmalate dehydratase small subunit [bacterium]
MICGRVHKLGHNVDTDAIIAVKWAGLTDPKELGKHCMETVDPDFAKRVNPGDILVAGRNFGCGSSREIAPWSIKGAGIACVVAESFARIFFRNGINISLPLIQCAEAARAAQEGDILEIDTTSGKIRNRTQGILFQASPYPEFIQELIRAGGLVDYTRERLTRGI